MGRSQSPSLDDLAALLRARISAWRDADLIVSPLAGGITNLNYRVDVDGTPHVVRVGRASEARLAIDRDAEWHNTSVAASLGIAPRFLHRDAAHALTVREYLPGRTMNGADLRAPGMPARLGAMLRPLHAGPKFHSTFSLLSVAQRYIQQIEQQASPRPSDFAARRRQLERLSEILERAPVELVPCHNDLVAENVIEHAGELRLIDFEYSGNNDPCFELGNACCELEFADEQCEELCRGYFQREPTPRELARVRLQSVVSDVGWSLWAAVQAEASDVEFDYETYGQRRWERAQARLASAEFDRWALEL